MMARVWIMATVALVLGGLVAREYWPAPPEPITAAPKSMPAKPTLNPMGRRQNADFAALFDHPLFDPTRQPAMTEPALSQDLPPPAHIVIEATPTANGPAQPMLMGTVTSPWPGGAFVGDDQGGPVVFLRPGQQAQGLYLQEVGRESALFKGPNGEVTLTLQPAILGLPLAETVPGNVMTMPVP